MSAAATDVHDDPVAERDVALDLVGGVPGEQRVAVVGVVLFTQERAEERGTAAERGVPERPEGGGAVVLHLRTAASAVLVARTVPETASAATVRNWLTVLDQR
ncbi:hypothetical protein GCM10018773_11290 [Streptomyces candidus]|nr:hypothetical protein GCM10018773_11290 [Streptomyces candidus]